MLANEKITVRNRLGFIGLGYLGSRIARRLVAAGFPMIVYDRDHTKAAELSALGARVARDPEKLAGEVDVVLSSLTDDSAVQAVYLGTGNVLRSARPGTRIIELSTISPETSRELHRAARQLELSSLDVAISGSTPSAEAGTLTLFGGGEPEIFESAEAIFAAIAKQWFYMGPGGSGVSMKLVVNTLLGVGMQAVAEALALGSNPGPASRPSLRHTGQDCRRCSGPCRKARYGQKGGLRAAISASSHAQGFRTRFGRGGSCCAFDAHDRSCCSSRCRRSRVGERGGFFYRNPGDGTAGRTKAFCRRRPIGLSLND